MNSFGRLLVVSLLLIPFSFAPRTGGAADPAKPPNAKTPPIPQDDPIVEQVRAIHRLDRQVNELSQQLQAMENRLAVLRAELNRLKGGLPDFRYPLPVLGRVKSISKDGIVLISLGSDDTVGKGHRLAVTRVVDGKPQFVAALQVTQTTPDTATCKVTSTASNRLIAPGDAVAAILDYSGVVGIVIAVQGKGLVEISLGSDDGLKKGIVLPVYRADGTTYLGKIKTLETRPDRAVCRVLPETQKGVITKGDRVGPPRD